MWPVGQSVETSALQVMESNGGLELWRCASGHPRETQEPWGGFSSPAWVGHREVPCLSVVYFGVPKSLPLKKAALLLLAVSFPSYKFIHG